MVKAMVGESQNEPQLTIGLPVFNGGSMIGEAIESLLRQTYAHFVLHISDNASTDGTSEICRAAAERDPRILYTRQPENIGAEKNFWFVLERVHTPFFMWAAHDDLWKPLFVEKNLAALEANPSAVSSVSQIAFTRDGAILHLSNATYPLRGTVSENLRKLWAKPGDNSRLYAIHRTEALQQSVPVLPLEPAWDWIVTTLLLRFGHYLEVPEVLLWRTAPEPHRYARAYRSNRAFLFRIFPFLNVSYVMVKYLGLRHLPAVFKGLLRTNILTHTQYVHHFYPNLYRFERDLYRRLGLKKLGISLYD